MDEEVRVVVVDDLVDAASTLAMSLRLDGYQVMVAYDGGQALVLIDQHHPHCVILDVDMPGIDGNELSRRLRERYADDIVLIAMSGRDEGDQRVSETFERVDHYLRKPINLALLQKVLPPLHAT